MARFLGDGRPDFDFGDRGVVRLDVGGRDEEATGVALQADGAIVVAGITGDGFFERDLVAVRLAPDGARDASFGEGGIARVGLGNVHRGAGLALQGDGRIVIAGAGGARGNPDFVVARLTPDGASDPGFGSDGLATADFSDQGGTRRDYPGAVALQPGGGIVVAGRTQTEQLLCPGTGTCSPPPPTSRVALARFTTGGVLDPTFGTGGRVTTTYAPAEDGRLDSLNSAVLQPDGRIVAAGTTNTGGQRDILLTRHLPDGTPDTTFGAGGAVVAQFATGDNGAYAVTLLPDTRLAVAGSTTDFPGRMAIARFHPNGAADLSFGGDGLAAVEVPGARGPAAAYAIAALGDGRLVVAGSVGTDDDHELVVARLLPDAGPDTPGPPPPGYRLVAADGGVFSFGNTTFHGSAAGVRLNRPVVGMAATPNGAGYWLVAADGGVFAYGDAPFLGSTGDLVLNRPVVGMAATPTGAGYWLVAADGGIFSFGDAAFFGSAASRRLDRPVTAMAATPNGRGYRLVTAGGEVFHFGDARSGTTIRFTRPIVGIATSPATTGFWLVSADGFVHGFGGAGFYGWPLGLPLNRPVVSIAATPTGRGYWVAAADGGVFAYGDARFLGSTGSATLNEPVVGIVAP